MEKIIEGAIFGDIALVKEELKKGANPDSQYRGYTSLQWAVQEGHLNIVEVLIEHGADIENRDEENGFSILDSAVGECAGKEHFQLENQMKIVQLLINKGVDVNGETANCSVLHTAAAYGLKEVVELLLNHGAKTDIKDSDDKLAFDFALEYGYKEIAELIKY